MSITVLTGDIIESTKLNADLLEQVQRAIAETFSEISGWGTPARFSEYRGDGWQIAFENASLSLRAALIIRAKLRAIDRACDTRIAIAQGSGKLPEKIETTTDAAFVLSGRTLDQMQPAFRMASGNTPEMDAICILLDQIVSNWTSTQARTILPFLAPDDTPRQQDVAAQMGVSRQSIGKTLEAASYPYVIATLKLLEARQPHA
jgi:hypothetical protein